ncbi:hypothetical protein EPUL_001718 [Erysiphe pulchra]|uniref:Immunogenic protein n=1 Tax=Erysiphe pulchra TaxID=225359 RepID=A0A2S4PZY1_9PEZI|nr:hypothetical protein EPUL_001718 [Erysiphe pulchra]
MSEAVKTQEPGPAQTIPESSVVNVEVDKSIPEPVVEEPAIKELAPAPTPVAPAEATVTEETTTEKPKETEKSDDLARSLFKGFQSKLAGVFPKKTEKSSDVKEEKKEVSNETKEEIKDEEKETKERRSASRKRNSFFGGLVLGKKDEKSEVDESAVTDSNKDATIEPKKSAEASSEPPVTTEAPASSEAQQEKPAGPFKRASIFGTLKHQFARKEKSETTVVPKETESSATAPVIPAVGTSDAPVKEEVATEAIVDKAQEVQATVEAKAEKLVTKIERRKSTLPFGLGLGKKEKLVSSDDEAYEKPLSPFARIRATVRSRTSPKHAPEKKEEPVLPVEPKKEEAASEPLVTDPEPPVTIATPVVAASA